MPQALMLLVARLCVAAVFVLDGWARLRGYGAAAATLRGQGVPFAALVLPVLIGIELAGGAAVAAGFKARLAAWLLIAAWALVNYYSGAVWRGLVTEFPAPSGAFINQLSIIAGLLFLAAGGPGRISVDRS
jgi:putative oxidoreductase